MRRLGRWLLWAILAIFAFVVLLQAWYAVHIWWWRDHPPRETAFMSMRLSELQAKRPQARLQYVWVPYERISVKLKQAMDKNFRKGRVVAGGSTISQQLAKNLFLSGERSYWRKAEEAAITVMLEAILDKRRIFELYLNVIEWGNGVFGSEAAARHYFGIGAGELNAEQAARLAAMAPNPRHYESTPNSKGLARKVPIILARMPSAELP